MKDLNLTEAEQKEVRESLDNSELIQLCAETMIYAGELGGEKADDFWDKARRIELDGCQFGDKVRICWAIPDYDRFSDIGYLTAIPGVSTEDQPEFSTIIHVPDPKNPGGKGDVDGEYISVYSAIENPHIVSIKPLARRRGY